MKKSFYFIFIFCFSVVYVIFLFKNINAHQFLFIHDETLIISPPEAFKSFFTTIPDNLGIPNSLLIFASFYDRLYYSIIYQTGFNLHQSEIIFYFVKFFTLLALPLVGFFKLKETFFPKSKDIQIFVVSLWYSLNTLTLIYWNTAAFPFTILFAYALAPLTFYYLNQILFKKFSLYNIFVFTLFYFLMIFSLAFFVVFTMEIVVYTIIVVYFKRLYPRIFPRVLLFLFIFLPMAQVISFVIYDMFINPIQLVNSSGGAMYIAMKGGVFYQLLMLYSWVIYNIWKPKNVFSFYHYFFSPLSVIAPFFLYIFALYGIIKEKKNIFVLIFVFLFLFFLTLVKGAQPPFGEIYLYLLHHVPMFSLFRTPDYKFSFALIFILSMLLLFAAPWINKKIFVVCLFLIILIQSFPLFTGIAILGQNTSYSSDRIISMPDTYLQASNYINNNAKYFGYVMVIPTDNYTNFSLDNKLFIGQDILSKLITLPFLYYSPNSEMAAGVYDALTKKINSNQKNELSDFPIEYFILRKDIMDEKNNSRLKNAITTKNKLVFSNKVFRIYKNENPVPLIESENIQFSVVNPVTYIIHIHNLKTPRQLFFNQNFSKGWNLYVNKNSQINCGNVFIFDNNDQECKTKQKAFMSSELSYLWEKPVFPNSHKRVYEYANQWMIDPTVIKETFNKNDYKVNADGSLDVNLILYYKPQAYFYWSLLLMGATILIFLTIIAGVFIKGRKNK